MTASYIERIEALRQEKLKQTEEKRQILGDMNFDDWALVLPPVEQRNVAKVTSSSGNEMTDCLFNWFEPESNHPNGGFFGPRAVGGNYRRILENHPVYIDPNNALAGAYMTNFVSYRRPHWNPDFDFSHLKPEQEKYGIMPGIGFVQHFCPDVAIGMALGWGGLLDKINKFRAINQGKDDFYDGLEAVVLGMQNWIARHAEAASSMAAREEDPLLAASLAEMAEINQRLITDPPQTFREACQWILWYLLSARMFDGSGSLGRIDVLLYPFYQNEIEAGTLMDEEATFYIACLLLRDTAYVQLGGPDASGADVTNPVSFLVLKAVELLKIPANVGVCVGDEVDPALLQRGVDLMVNEKLGIPKFLGIDNTSKDFTRNGYSIEDGRERIYSGCQWHALPGREYGCYDGIKLNLAAVFDVALREMVAEKGEEADADTLWQYYEKHLYRAVDVIADGIDFHMAHMAEVFPELVLNLCCHGPVEKGLDVTAGSIEYYNFGVDGSSLATAANAMASVIQRVVIEKRLTWHDLLHHLDTNWQDEGGELVRLMFKNVRHFGYGNTLSDEVAQKMAHSFSEYTRSHKTPHGYNMLPGFFSWVFNIKMGKALGATPDGRFAGDPISHGPNPSPGFRKDSASTALSTTVASVQPHYGCTAPLQIEMEPTIVNEKDSKKLIASFIRSHFKQGGTQINMNVMDSKKVLEANKDPSKYPDLVVRVTGFSAYFASLSPQLRQMIVDRIVAFEA